MRALILIFLSFASISQAAPAFETTDLFRAKTGDYALYRIPVLVVAPHGTLVALCEARKTAGSDWGTIDVLMRRSADGGKTWEPARKIASPPADVKRNPVAVEQKLGKLDSVVVGNPVAISDPVTGALHVLYCVEYALCFYMRSDDDGKTFGEPVEITATFDAFKKHYAWRVLATGPGHAIRLSKTGRLVVPVWLSTGEGGHGHRPSCVATIYSDDAGKNWQAGAIVVNHPELINPSETTVAELRDGRVMLNVRHEGPKDQPAGRNHATFRAVFDGPDGATNWGMMRLDHALAEPICMGSLLRVGNELLFANPDNSADHRRRNLTVKLSEDEGKSWPVSRVIDPGVSGYCDLAGSTEGKDLYCFYERGSTTDDRHNDVAGLTLVHFNMDWLREKERER
jgi:sialidase-1